MPAHMVLCNFTDQGARNIREAPSRRVRELAQKLGVDIKAGYLATGPYDLVIHVEAPNDEAIATFLSSIGSNGNVQTTTLKLFPNAEFEKALAGVV